MNDSTLLSRRQRITERVYAVGLVLFVKVGLLVLKKEPKVSFQFSSCSTSKFLSSKVEKANSVRKSQNVCQICPRAFDFSVLPPD